MGDAHCKLGDIPYRYDLRAPEVLGRPPIRHWVRSPFTGRSDITGRPGAQNFYPEKLQLQLTDFSGEGQVVLRGSDPDSPTRFYQSEGLNFRVPGQFSLNRSITVQAPQVNTGSASTTEGNSMTDVTGTSTVVNTTDRRLNATGDVIETGNHAPGAVAVQADFHMYKEAQQLTTINGADLVEIDGPTADDGTTIRLRKDARVRSANLSVTAGIPHDVQVFLHTTFQHYPYGWTTRVMVRDVTTAGEPVTVVGQTLTITNTSAPSSPSATLTFTPKSGRTYRVFINSYPPQMVRLASTDYLVVNSVKYGKADEPATVTLIAYNFTGSTTVTSKQVQVTSTTSAMVGSIAFDGAAATNYRYRVQYDSGRQRPVVDSVKAYVATGAQYTFDNLELGQGQNVWLGGSRAATDAQTWTYDFTNEDWDVQQALNAAATTAENVIALAHTDQFEYALTSGGDILRFDTTADAAHVAADANAVAICVAQDRLFRLSEDTTNGVVVTTFQLDSAGTQLSTVTIGYAKPTRDTTYRQRMVGTPTGARFFVNYSDVQCIIYEVDASGTVLVSRQVAVMDRGFKATSIAYSNNLTFVAGQFIAETGETPISALFVIEQNGVPRRIGELRDGNVNPPISMQPYQNDLWLLQGDRIWRYSLATGGIFLEYQLNPKTQANAKAIAVIRGHVFALYSDEGVFVAGSESTYRQASVTGGNSYTSSIYDFDLPGIDKELDSITVLTDEMPSATALQVEVQTNQSGTWTALGSSTQGSKHTFRLTSTSLSPIFQTVQVRVTLSSQTGANTPTVKGVTVLAWTAEEEEFFDAVLRIDNEDSSDHPSGVQRTAKTLAANLWALKDSRRPVEFIDNVDNRTYMVRVEDVDDQRDTFDDQGGVTGEGRAIVRLRVLR